MDCFDYPVSFVEIGAHDGRDGKKNDERGDLLCSRILSHNWRGLLIEPLPSAYKELVYNFGSNSNAITDNVAIHSSKHSVSFYDDKYKPGCSSVFKTSNIKKHIKNKREVSRIQVDALTMDEVLEKHQFDNFQILQIDVEGSEWEVIRSISLNEYRPDVIEYEHKHVHSLGLEEKIIKRLSKHGYVVYRYSKKDSIAICRNYFKAQKKLLNLADRLNFRRLL